MRFNPLRWAGNLLIWVDQGVNSVLGGAPDETLSSRIGRAKDRKGGIGPAIAREASKALDVIDKGHTDGAEAYEKKIIHRPESLDDRPGD